MEFWFIVELSQEILIEKNIPDAWILMQKNKQKSPKTTKKKKNKWQWKKTRCLHPSATCKGQTIWEKVHGIQMQETVEHHGYSSLAS